MTSEVVFLDDGLRDVKGREVQYVKIKEAIVEQIDSGMLTPRQKLPAERKFAELFNTTRVTLREALSSLEAEGKIYREDRRGWFISPEPLLYDPMRKLSFHEMATLQQRTPSTEVLSATNMLATKQACLLLELPPFTDVYCLERVRYLEGRPIAYTKKVIKSEFFPQLLSCDLLPSLTEIYNKKFGVVYQKTRYKISSTSLTGYVAQMLRATSGTPAMFVERINYDTLGRLVDCDIEYWRHDAICIESIAELV